MSRAIIYCDRCGKIILQSEQTGGRAIIGENFGICPGCAGGLPPAERKEITRKLSGEPEPKPPRPKSAVRQPSAARAASGKTVRAKRSPPSRRGEVRGAAPALSPKPRSGAGIAVAGITAGVLAGAVIIAFLAGGPSRRPGGRTARRSAGGGGRRTTARPHGSVEAPDVRLTAARKRLDEIKKTIDSFSVDNPRAHAALQGFLKRFPDAPEAKEAKELLAKMDAVHNAEAEAFLKKAEQMAKQLASQGRYAQAARALSPVRKLFGDTEWFAREGKQRIAAAREVIEKARLDAVKTIRASGSINDGLVAYWKFDAEANPQPDASGNGKNAEVKGASWTPKGKLGGALAFDGRDDHLVLPHGFSDFTRGMTLALWAYPTSNGRYARFIDFGNGEARDNILFLRRDTSADLDLHFYRGKARTNEVLVEGAIELNRWQHFAATVDASGRAALYKDGEEIAGGKLPLPSNVNRTRSYIGKSNWRRDAHYKGRMDDVRVYNRSLSAQEILELVSPGK